PRAGHERRARRRADGEYGRGRLACHGASSQPRVAHEDDRPGGPVDLFLADAERRSPGGDEVELLVSGRRLVVRRDDDVARRAAGPAVDPERADVEGEADRRPAVVAAQLLEAGRLVATHGSSSSSGTSRIGRAGLPTTTIRAGTSRTTTAPAPTNASSPISTAGQRIAPPPMRAPRLITEPLSSSCRRSVRPMKLSFVVTTHGATKTWSSSVEYAVMYASAWIFVRAPIVVSFSISEPRPSTTSSPTSTRSRTQDWSPRMTRAPIVEPAKTI